MIEIFGGRFGINWFFPFKTGGFEQLYKKILLQEKKE